ncbi:hypothetical protein M409DRAFT_15990 [Zasmidium cellare ATCC 36951]|uniref:Uncharacterized protein n=1 Tax=Zasmidium cellare ATCC 36951 TaxID=1080233 RepID=A0A6A6D7W3_ZASCE|nr:uncharacterized protein M409DRAFT_15990 [Zasmidium cellare ATCC 36951]KAF2173716.1 hypothetical protein M409DRAFT_15990 [Zasmidium cellare ATCC 36951]
MALTRSANKRPAPSAESGAPDSSSSGKRRKVSQGKKKTTSSPSSSTAVATSPSSLKKRTVVRARTSTSARLHLSQSSHDMRTRSKARIFPFFRLPAEIRNLIYSEAYGSDDPVDLADLRLPAELKVPEIFGEALPFFFESTPVVIPVMSNVCVRHQHLHRAEHERYERTGQVELPRILQEGCVPSKDVRFKCLHFRAKCCCCDRGKVLLDVDVQVVNRGTSLGALTETEVLNRLQVYASAVAELDKMVDVVKGVVDEISGRENFNGFTVDDVKRLAMCFRNDEDDGKSPDHSDDMF